MKGPDWDLLEHLGKRKRADVGLRFGLIVFILGVAALIVAVW